VKLADRFDAFFLDIDGDVYVGDQALPGAAETIAKLRADGKRVLFLTNDPPYARRVYAAKLARLGIPATEDDVLTSGWAKAVYLSRHEGVEGRMPYVIGTQALRDEPSANPSWRCSRPPGRSSVDRIAMVGDNSTSDTGRPSRRPDDSPRRSIRPATSGVQPDFLMADLARLFGSCTAASARRATASVSGT
jgi:Haloacid dehalogenase-like hydrolase